VHTSFQLRSHLPSGGKLPDGEWERRHSALTVLLFGSMVVLVIYAALAGYPSIHVGEHLAAMLPLALVAAISRFSRRVRTMSCALGLLTGCALAVHTSGGLTEAHFTFFVVVIALTLYEDWSVFAVAVVYTLVHHGALGMIDPHQVFQDPAHYHHPWRWAAIHAAFVAACGIVGVIAWRLNEDIRHQMRDAHAQLDSLARTDALTGLPNRRQLLADLEEAAQKPETRLALFDLDGFKGYNDSFGHHAGDALLTRLGGRLAAAVEGVGTAYRLGGDEFCVLLRPEAPARTLADAAQALTERGEMFAVGSSHGELTMGEAESASDALVLADRRMYARKNGGRGSAGRESTDVLLGALAERFPALIDHVNGVARMAVDVARRLGVDEWEQAVVARAAELHDVGKVAIPEDILLKPGRLTADEWAFMRRHTEIGERILAAAPSLSGAAKIVRGSHERWDGAGYPDGLAGQDIPLGARIVAVCDAFDAMVSDRPYRRRLPREEALAELRRCAGGQFDPAVVSAFLDAVAGDPQPVAVPVVLRATEAL
jgi:diguanylate cyclase (GGDEF)-like protein